MKTWELEQRELRRQQQIIEKLTGKSWQPSFTFKTRSWALRTRTWWQSLPQAKATWQRLGAVSLMIPFLWLGTCSTGQAKESGKTRSGIASYYSSKDTCKYNPYPGCPTASGISIHDLEARRELFAAMWSLPFGTRVRVTNQENGKSEVFVIRDRGPAKRLNRVIDLCEAGFNRLSDFPAGSKRDPGILNVTVEVAP